MIRRLLVPLDGSALAESILPCVQEVAALTGAEVTLLQVVESAEPPSDLFGRALPLVDEGLPELADLMRAAREYLLTVARAWALGSAPTHTQVTAGTPVEAIVAAAADFDLVAMATHGRSGIGRWVFGSVADKVLRAAPVPVLLVRADQTDVIATGHPRRVIVPLDGSPLAEQALPLAIELARAARAELVLTRSIRPGNGLGIGHPLVDGLTVLSLTDQAEAGAASYLQAVADQYAGAGLVVQCDVRIGPAADSILACVAERQGDLIVMSTHGRGGLGRWVYGSTADRVLRGSAVPVLLVRAAGSAGVVGAARAPAIHVE